jgi:tetratricopeptide (TPR) repeat protein
LAKTPARVPEAVAEYEAALRLDPQFAEAYCNLGTVLLGLPDRRADARAQFEAALRIRPDLEPARRMVERLRGPP